MGNPDPRRERTVAKLRERALDGELPLDTFASRVDAAYRASTDAELAVLVADLPPRRGLGRIAHALRRTLTGVGRRPVPAAQGIQIEVRLPRSVESVTVGRSSDCDVVVGERSVSRFHAELRHDERDDWTVRDLDSKNGTWVNGARVQESRVVRGDVLSLGGLRMELRL